MTEPDITPDEVKRLRLDPGDRLIVRVADRWTNRQLREYREYLQTHFPDNEVLVIVGEEIAIETNAPEPQRIEVQGSNTLMSDEDIKRLAEEIAKRLGPPKGGIRTLAR